MISIIRGDHCAVVSDHCDKGDEPLLPADPDPTRLRGWIRDIFWFLGECLAFYLLIRASLLE